VRVIRDLKQVSVRRPLCLAMGVFDGVHLGHQAIISEAVGLAAGTGGLPAVLTFDRHPMEVLFPDGAPPLLTTTEEKLDLIRGLGIRLAVVARFDRRLAETPAEKFVSRALAQQLRARCLVVGEDWRFGAGRAGTTALLRRMAPQLGFEVRVVQPVVVRGRRVSSTRIRALILRGQVAAARDCLARHYQVSGRVVAGEGRGRELGYPTANLEPPAGKLIPRDGVYACWAGPTPGRQRHARAIGVWPAVASIGVRPTFERRGARRIEVHLLEADSSGGHGHARPTAARRTSLPGREMRVLFVQWLRGEIRFASSEALVKQMGRDCTRARRVLALQAPADVLSSEQQ